MVVFLTTHFFSSFYLKFVAWPQVIRVAPSRGHLIQVYSGLCIRLISISSNVLLFPFSRCQNRMVHGYPELFYLFCSQHTNPLPMLEEIYMTVYNSDLIPYIQKDSFFCFFFFLFWEGWSGIM